MNDVRHAILQILWGPKAFQKVVLAPGDVVRVGRSEDCDLVLSHDKDVSKIHFEIDWDGSYCELRDKNSPIGTMLGGKRAVQERVPHGSWIRAGSTDFLVFYEAETPPSKPPSSEADRKQVVQVLSTEPSLYGVFDAARDPRILVLLRESIDDCRWLYEGARGHALADVAPYLVHFVPGSRLLRALVEEGWGDAWGIYVVSDVSMKEVRRHFRRLLMVEDETSGKHLYFRFYDPRVLRDFLPIATVRQKSDLYGDLQAFVFEGTDNECVRENNPHEVNHAAHP